MKNFLSKTSICVFLISIIIFEMFCIETPVEAKSFNAPTVSAAKYNNDAGIKVTIKKVKKAKGYEIYVCPAETVSLYEGYVNSFYVEGIQYDSLAGSWHEKGEYYLQADVKSTGKKKLYYYIKYMQPGTYKVKVRAYYDTNGSRVYSKYSKVKTITIGPDAGGNGLKTEYDFSGLEVGDEFEFGSYEIDGNLKNGYEPIKWKVLSKNEDNIFVISKYALDILPYNKDYGEVTWENCTLRKWLNNKFYNVAFNESERNLIKEMDITNENNSIYGTNGGNVTKDKIIILSQQDLVNASYGFSTSYDEYDINRRCPVTGYAFNSGLWVFDTYTNSEGTGSCFWWARTPGYGNDYVTYVHDFGCIYSDGNAYDTGYATYSHGIRPAMFISLNSNINTYKLDGFEYITVNNLKDEYCFKQETSLQCTKASSDMLVSLARDEVFMDTGWVSNNCTWLDKKENPIVKTGYRHENAQTKRNVCGQMVTKGIPSALRLGDEWNEKKQKWVGHTVVVVGVKKDCNLNEVKDSDLLIIDPAVGKIKVLSDLEKSGCWHGGVNAGLNDNDWSVIIPKEYDWEGFDLKTNANKY